MAKINLPSAERLRHLYVMQTKAKSKSARTRATNELREIAKEMQQVANRRLRALRASDYAYGTVYDTTENYLEQRGQRYFNLSGDLSTRTKIGKNQGVQAEGYELTQRLRRFLSSPETTIRGQKLTERVRFNTYRNYYAFAKDMNDSELRSFLKFLGNSGIDEYLAYYGEASGDEVEELADMWVRSGTEEQEKIKELFEQFADFQKTAKDVERGILSDKELETKTMDFTTLRKELDTIYESIEKRHR